MKKESNRVSSRLRLFLIFNFPLLILLPSCETDLETINQVTSVQNLPSETMTDAEILYSDSAKVKMKLIAKQLDRYSGEKIYIEMPKGLKMFFYDDSLKVNSQMKADYGKRYEKEGIMEAKRNVEVINIKGEKLNTEHLIWNENKDSIYTKAFVKITTKDEVIYGDGLESNQDFTRYRILNVKGMVNIHEKQENNNK